ncbi:P-type conjugative transfer protein TrbG [Rhizobium ruizarguesonis]|uniref:P-type conjugative transfer protein TrbG n=1 Tax=Rhizobium ruizarguesonis TaxID=2081791 RepID=UPI001FEFA0C6|nr:P-type conjugative transfer protein TrbG [Rhizobium ruizarguesonis]
MKKTGLIAAAGCMAGLLLAAGAQAQSMTSNEVKGTNLSRKWRGTPGLVTTGPDGKVIFLFGETQPSVVCSPLQVCDIELQGGEIVRDVLVGDTVRWKVEPATSGATGGQAIHLIVKPSEPGLLTSMVVTTSRRTYHIQLKSHPSQYMARIGFEYPEDVSTKLADINARLETGGIPGTAPDKLNFSYSVSGSAPWKAVMKWRAVGRNFVVARGMRTQFAGEESCGRPLRENDRGEAGLRSDMPHRARGGRGL